MKYLSVANPRWSNQINSTIDCDVEFEGLGVVPFTASPTDTEEHGREIFAKVINGDFGSIAPYVPYVPTDSELKQQSINDSKAALSRTDIAMSVDGFQRLTSQEQIAMTVFRDAHFDNVTAGGTTDQNWNPTVSTELQNAFDKFRI